METTRSSRLVRIVEQDVTTTISIAYGSEADIGTCLHFGDLPAITGGHIDPVSFTLPDVSCTNPDVILMGDISGTIEWNTGQHSDYTATFTYEGGGRPGPGHLDR